MAFQATWGRLFMIFKAHLFSLDILTTTTTCLTTLLKFQLFIAGDYSNFQ